MRCGRLVSAFVGVVVFASELSARERWTAESANAWYEQRPWLVGANFTPSTAVNQLEMWQAETFDPLTVDQVFEWAREGEPTQPLTAGVWVGPWPEGKPLSPIERVMLEQWDAAYNWGW